MGTWQTDRQTDIRRNNVVHTCGIPCHGICTDLRYHLLDKFLKIRGFCLVIVILILIILSPLNMSCLTSCHHEVCQVWSVGHLPPRHPLPWNICSRCLSSSCNHNYVIFEPFIILIPHNHRAKAYVLQVSPFFFQGYTVCFSAWNSHASREIWDDALPKIVLCFYEVYSSWYT